MGGASGEVKGSRHTLDKSSGKVFPEEGTASARALSQGRGRGRGVLKEAGGEGCASKTETERGWLREAGEGGRAKPAEPRLWDRFASQASHKGHLMWL